MTSTATKLLAQKEELLQRLEQGPGDKERAEIEQLLAKINTALNLLDEARGRRPELQAERE
jgi:hypothetical protein